LAKAERNYEISKISVLEKTREMKALENKIKALEKDLTFDKPLAEIKKILWINITQSINYVLPSIQVIYEQMDLVKGAHGAIQQTRAQLGQMPEQANRLIHFLNAKNKEQLEVLGILDRRDTILEIKRVLTKRTLMQNLERRCQDMQVEINSFMEKFIVLQNKGLPSPLVINDKLMKHMDYVDKLNKYDGSQASSSTGASGINAVPIGRVLYDSLENLFYIKHEVKHLFKMKPNVFRYTETDETLRKIQKTDYQSQNGGKIC